MRPVKRMVAMALAIGVGGGAIAAVAVAPAIAGSTATTPTIKLMNTSKGKLLSVKGKVLYLFTRDTKNHNSCVKIAGCKSVWPALTSAGKPIAGTGVRKSLLGRITIAGGKHQVTYAGHALYKYAFLYPGANPTSYVGVSEFGGRWDGVNAAGKAVR